MIPGQLRARNHEWDHERPATGHDGWAPARAAGGISSPAVTKVKYDAVLFDLLTGLIDSWSLWDRVAGARDAGRRWRAAYLQLTYGCGVYRPYETLVREAALATGLPAEAAGRLGSEWESLAPWDDAVETLERLRRDARIGVVTNCSERLGRRAASLLGVPFDVVVTAERAGFYKPDPPRTGSPFRS